MLIYTHPPLLHPPLLHPPLLFATRMSLTASPDGHQRPNRRCYTGPAIQSLSVAGDCCPCADSPPSLKYYTVAVSSRMRPEKSSQAHLDTRMPFVLAVVLVPCFKPASARPTTRLTKDAFCSLLLVPCYVLYASLPAMCSLLFVACLQRPALSQRLVLPAFALLVLSQWIESILSRRLCRKCCTVGEKLKGTGPPPRSDAFAPFGQMVVDRIGLTRPFASLRLRAVQRSVSTLPTTTTAFCHSHSSSCRFAVAWLDPCTRRCYQDHSSTPSRPASPQIQQRTERPWPPSWA